jgi:hypothetical protein
MLRGEEGHQFHFRGLGQTIDAMDPMTVDPGVVGDEADPEPSDQVKGVGKEDFQARANGRLDRV